MGGLRHRRVAKAGGHSYSPTLQSPRPSSTLQYLRTLTKSTSLDFEHDEAVADLQEAALEFWRCLQVAESVDTPEEVLHEARRRMKRLSPELHALYMRRANGSRGS